MRVSQIAWSQAAGWRQTPPASAADLILYFGSRAGLTCGARFHELKEMFPAAAIIGCSTGGQIAASEVLDDEIAGVAMRFDTTKIRLAHDTVASADLSRGCGRALGAKLKGEGLAGVFVLSDGLHVNGSELVAGIIEQVGKDVSVTGGLAGDGAQFEKTLVGADCAPKSHAVAAVGFYGNAIRIGHGSAGGWDVFGPRRKITKSKGNVLFELDGEPALDLYERYLGEEAKGLPGTGLLFPLQVQDPNHPEHLVVRTILGIDRDKRSMTFAGDVPEGWGGQLMRGTFTRLAEGSAEAARQAQEGLADGKDREGVAVLVSCIGRRLLMGQRTTDELEAAEAELGAQLSRLGFYSYGEISPHAASGICELHNQTMTVTTITEMAA
jgi:hypothetical protein